MKRRTRNPVKRRKIGRRALLTIIVFAVLVVFPTPHTLKSETLLYRMSLNLDLTPGPNGTFHKEENLNSGTVCRFVVDVKSNATVNITIAGVQGLTVGSAPLNYIDQFIGTSQAVNFTSSYNSYVYGIFEPNNADNSSARVEGFIDTYKTSTTTQLLPWWWP